MLPRRDLRPEPKVLTYGADALTACTGSAAGCVPLPGWSGEQRRVDAFQEGRCVLVLGGLDDAGGDPSAVTEVAVDEGETLLGLRTAQSGEDADELVAAVTEHDVVGAQALSQRCGDGGEQPVARRRRSRP